MDNMESEGPQNSHGDHATNTQREGSMDESWNGSETSLQDNRNEAPPPVSHPQHRHHSAASRELHTAESIMEYIHDLEEEKHHQPPQYKDYLKAQKHMKHNIHSTSNSKLKRVEESHRGSSNHRNRSIHAMSVLSSRQGSALRPQEWRAFLDKPVGSYENKKLQQPRNQEEQEKIPEKDSENNMDDKDSQQEQDDNDQADHEEEDDKSYHGHSLTVPWYCRPVQRQRWNDDQVLPHINWGDLFFDLFYVAAAYNLGGMLISAMNANDWPRGVVYFIGIFGPLYNIWENDVVYSSRYTLVDYSHRVIAVMRFFCVSFAVLSIKPLAFLGDKKSVETFCLTLALFCESICQLGLSIELYFYGEGDRTAIQNHTYRQIVYQFVPTSVTYMVAAIIAGVSFFSEDSSTDDYGYETDNTYGSDDHDGSIYHIDYGNKTAYDDDHVYEDGQHERGHFLFRLLAAASSSSHSECDKDDGHRMLAGGYEEDCVKGITWTIADVPLMLCLSIYVLNILHNLFRKYTNSNTEGGQDIRQQYVPNNIDYMIHRYGEWIMLMIGESILSLLIVETIEAADYYAITGLGCLTVIVLQMLKFESEPSHADGHALWRSRLAATLFSLLIQILSIGLIAFGVSYKIMLTNVFKEEVAEALDDHRRLAAIPTITDAAVSRLFSGALCLVLLSLEMMLGTHKGVTKSYQLLFHEIETFHIYSLNWPLMIISLFKVGLICFTATLNHWATDPTNVAFIGFLIVTSMAITRIVGWGFVHHEKEIMDTVNFITEQTTDLGRNIVLATQSMGTDLVYTTHEMAKKTLYATTTSFGLDLAQSNMGSTVESLHELAMDRALWDTSFDAVVVTDRSGLIKYVNDNVLREFGYGSEEDLLGKNVSVLVGGGEAAYHHIYMGRFNKNEKQSTTLGKQRKLKARKQDGSEFTCLIGIRAVPNSGLLVGYIRPTSDDVKEDNEYQVDDTSFDSIIVISPQGKILNVNLTTISEFGFASKKELLGRNISLLVGGGEAENHDSYLANFESERKDASTIGNKKVLHAKRKDGNEFPCVIGIKRTPDGENLIGYIRNMTGITPEDIALKEKTKYLVDDTSFDAIVVTDSEGVMLQVNTTAVEEFGYKAKAELVGQNISILVGGGHAKHHNKYMKRFQKKGQEDSAIGKQRTLRARRKDGTNFTCVIGIRRIPDTDCLVGYIRSTQGLSKSQIAAEYDSVSQMSTKTSRSGNSVGSRSQIDGGDGADDILDESFDAVIVADFNGLITRVNQTVLDIFRYESKEELVGKNISALVGGGEAEAHDAYLERFQSLGKNASQIGKQRVLYSRRKDGTEFPCIIGIKRTPKNDGLVGWIRDMSDLKEQGSTIKITNMKLLDPVERLVDDASFDAIIVTDVKGVIRRVNLTTVREFRYESKGELVGKNVSDLVGGKVSARAHDKYLERFQKAGKSSSTIGKQRILMSKRKDGSEFRCIIGINRIPNVEEELLIGYIRNLEMTYEVNDSHLGSNADGASSLAAFSKNSNDSQSAVDESQG